MKKYLLIAALLALLVVPSTSFARSQVGTTKDFGAGVQLGYPGNGLSFNWFMGKKVSLQVNATLWLEGDWSGLGARVDLLWWQKQLASGKVAELHWYFGPGGNIYSFTHDGPGDQDAYVGLGAEFPVGLGVRFAKAPIDVNLEAVPVLHIIGSGGTDVGFGIAGVLNGRYYF